MVMMLAFGPVQPVNAKSSNDFKRVKTTMYAFTMKQPLKPNLYFKGKGDIPYICLEEWEQLIPTLYSFEEPSYKITGKAKGKKYTLKRENGYTAVFDFEKNTLYFPDVDAFFHTSNSSLASRETIGNNVAGLFSKTEESIDRFGSDLKIDFKKYGIKIYAKGGLHFIPLQTYSDVFLSRGVSGYVVYNGKNIFLQAGSHILADDMMEEYLKAPKRKMSKAFINFNYGELCLGLDYLYGLKEAHGIATFDRFFTETGLGFLLKTNKNNATYVDTALKNMINYYIDDGHTGYGGISYNSDYNGNKELYDKFMSMPKGPCEKHLDTTRDELLKSYNKAYPGGEKCYEEVGDTAFIKFDVFDFGNIEDYTSAPTEKEASEDTIRLIQYSRDKILRKNSPIKKVVLDLSINGGGYNSLAIYVIGFFLGEGNMAQMDVTTGAYSNASYKVDTNRDGKFDSEDYLVGKGLDLYCFTSNFSFSCGNMVPCRFKDSGKVTLVGQTTGGGSCSVGYMSTASGSTFQLSSPWRYSFTKNGSFYDVDRGADPDIYVKNLEKLYDRKYMVTFLDKVD